MSDTRFLPKPESVVKGLEHEAKVFDFEILKELGSGSYGKVYLVKHKQTKAEYAIKVIDKKKMKWLTKKILEEQLKICIK